MSKVKEQTAEVGFSRDSATLQWSQWSTFARRGAYQCHYIALNGITASYSGVQVYVSHFANAFQHFKHISSCICVCLSVCECVCDCVLVEKLKYASGG